MTETLKIETLYGEITGFKDDLISRHLERFSEWAPFESQLANAVLKPGQIVFDAGAFIGTFGLSVLPSEPAQICAVEANGVTFEVLSADADKISAGIIKPERGALGLRPTSENSGRVLAVDPENRGGAKFVEVTESGNNTDLNLVAPLTLPELRETHGDYHLAKLDLEGCELRALKADKNYLNKAKPTLTIEANDAEETCQVANYCRWLGYEVGFFDMPIWRKENPKGATEPFFALAHEAMLVAVSPGTMPDPSPELLENGGRFVPIKNSGDVIEALWRTPRWSTQAWAKMSREELIAILGRLDRGTTRASFQTEIYPKSPFGVDD